MAVRVRITFLQQTFHAPENTRASASSHDSLHHADPRERFREPSGDLGGDLSRSRKMGRMRPNALTARGAKTEMNPAP